MATTAKPSQENGLFHPLDAGDLDQNGPTEIESLCIRCEENVSAVSSRVSVELYDNDFLFRAQHAFF